MAGKGSEVEAPPEEISPEKRAKVEEEREGIEVNRSPAGDDATPMETSTSQSASASAEPEKLGFGTRRKPVVIIVIGMAGKVLLHRWQSGALV